MRLLSPLAKTLAGLIPQEKPLYLQLIVNYDPVSDNFHNCQV
jgi:hypothetical protein